MSCYNLDFKLRVFISSRCGGKYAFVRASLKKLLETTGLAEVYSFEESAGSSENVISSYLSELELCDLCIVLIDNKDGVSDPVFSEQKRAREKGLRLLYLFCDEEQKEATSLQKDLINNNLEKVKTVHEFTQMANVAFDSAISDILNIYRHRSQVVEKAANDEEVLKDTIIDSNYTVSGNRHVKLGKTKKAFRGIVISFDYDEEESDDYDVLLSSFAKFIIKDNSYDESVTVKIKEHVIAAAPDYLKKALKYRFNALNYYYKEDYLKCLYNLKQALDECAKDTKIPVWFANDIAIDLRNTQNKIDEKSNIVINPNNEGQVFLNNSSEAVFYPYIDRRVKEIYEKLFENHYKFSHVSPYTTIIGGASETIEKISVPFQIALQNASITHLQIVPRIIADSLAVLCDYYTEHDLFFNLIKFLIINHDEKKIESIIRTYNLSEEMLNSNDIVKILSCINNVTDSLDRIVCKFLLISHFGYSFSDDDFNNTCSELVACFNEWANGEQGCIKVGNWYYRFLRECRLRLDIHLIVDCINSTIDHSLKRFYSDCCKIASEINLRDADENIQQQWIEVLLRFISDEEFAKRSGDLCWAIINICLQLTIDYQELSNVIKEKMPSFYDSWYKNELLISSDDEYWQFVKSELAKQQTHIIQNSKTGVHTNSSSSLVTIKEIIKNKRISVNKYRFEEIFSITSETVYNGSLSVRDKINALRLLLTIISIHPETKYSEKALFAIVKNEDTITKGYELISFEKETNLLLRFVFLLVKNLLNTSVEMEISKLLLTNNYENYNTIQMMKYIKEYVELYDKRISLFLINQFVNFFATHIDDTEVDIRFNAVNGLISLLIFDEYRDIVLVLLSDAFDSGTREIKCTIVSRIKRIKRFSGDSFAELILQKARTDNNYLVRKIANRQ